MEVRDQPHPPAALRFEKEAPEPTEYNAGWDPETVYVLQKRSISLSLAMVRHAARLTSGGSLRNYTQWVHHCVVEWQCVCVFLMVSVFWSVLTKRSHSGENLRVRTSALKPCSLVNVTNVEKKTACFFSTVQIKQFTIPVRVIDSWYPWRNHN
jgi:hypothetical protein